VRKRSYFMDSAGYYLPSDVKERVETLIGGLNIPVGFHAHNNLGMAIANSVTAVESGAEILDGCARGFGAGAGNAQLEVLIAVLHRMKYQTGIDFYKVLDAADLAEKELMPAPPTISSVSIVSGLSGVFSGFMKPVTRIAAEYKLDPRDIFFELGRRKVIAGQERLYYGSSKRLGSKKWTNAMSIKQFNFIQKDIKDLFESIKISELDGLKNSSLCIPGGAGFVGTWISEIINFLNTEHKFNTKVTVIDRDIEKIKKRAPHLLNSKLFDFQRSDIRYLVELLKIRIT
jgi:isopropylmalate/homocitrate/citramalate synthase